MLLLTSVSLFGPLAYSQEPGLATFQETAQMLVDNRITNSVTVSVTLQSTDNTEILIPDELVQQILDDSRVKSILFTNYDPCVQRIEDSSCILINVEIDPDHSGIADIYNSTRMAGDDYIDSLNSLFDADAEFYSNHIHTDDTLNNILGTSGAVASAGTVSAVYDMSVEATSLMFEKLSSILIHKDIRDGQGFYSIAENLASHPDSKVTLSLIPFGNDLLMQLRLSVNYDYDDNDKYNTFPVIVDPLEYFEVEQINRSSYLASNFFPLNSLIQVVIIGDSNSTITDVAGNIIPTRLVDGQQIPTNITTNGWIFDPSEGPTIQAKYIFGQESFIMQDELLFTLDVASSTTTTTTSNVTSLSNPAVSDTNTFEPPMGDSELNTSTNDSELNTSTNDPMTIILIAIIVATVTIVVYYFKSRGK